MWTARKPSLLRAPSQHEGRCLEALPGARGGAAGLLAGRLLTGHDGHHERLLKAISETELWQRAVLDLLCRHVLDNGADSRQVEDCLATRPWPQAHADLLGPDRDAMVALPVRLMNATGRTEALASWTEAQQLVGRRMPSSGSASRWAKNQNNR